MSILARSANWTVSNDYEEVRAQRADGLNVCIADHYGDATCATIAEDESWVAVGGEGVTIYFLRPPFNPYQRSRSSEQWRDLLRDPSPHNVEGIYQNWDTETPLRVVVDLCDLEKRGVYSISLDDFRVERLLPGQLDCDD